jgi:hypothetical protein
VRFAGYPVNVLWVSCFLQEFWERNKCIGCPLHVHVVKERKEMEGKKKQKERKKLASCVNEKMFISGF